MYCNYCRADFSVLSANVQNGTEVKYCPFCGGASLQSSISVPQADRSKAVEEAARKGFHGDPG